MNGLAAQKDAQNSCLLDTSRLRKSSVLLIGAGGLGCGIAVSLAGAGVGEIVICDYDKVSAGNLNRQFLYKASNIGKSKAELAAKRIAEYAPDCRVTSISQKVYEDNAERIVDGYDMVMLASDNMPVRLAVNSACVRLGATLADAGISGCCGRVYIYIPKKTPCLACLESGQESRDKRTVGAAAGIISGFAAFSALKFLSDGFCDKAGKLILIDANNGIIDELAVKRLKNCNICGGVNNAG